MDKSLANQLLEMIEGLWIENLALGMYIKEFHRLHRRTDPQAPQPPTLQQLIEAKRRSPETLLLAKQIFAPLRQQVEGSQDFEQLLRSFVEKFPINKDVN